MSTKNEQEVALKENDTVTFAVAESGGRIFEDEQGRTFITAEVAPDYEITFGLPELETS